MSDNQDLRRKWLLDLNTALYEKSTNYTNLIIVAGYAGFISMWSETSKLISVCLARVSASLFLFSLLVFISWEIAKMILTALHSRGMAKLAIAPEETFEEELHKFERKGQLLTAKLTVAWPVVLFLSIPTAFIAVAIHIWGLVSANFGL